MENFENKITIIKRHSLLILIIIFILSGCSSRKGIPYSEPVTLNTEELENGEKLFESHCNSCHPGGSSGLGPAINNKPLPKFLIRFQVRHGLGVMPDFDDDILNDKEVKEIAKYLVYLRKNG